MGILPSGRIRGMVNSAFLLCVTKKLKRYLTFLGRVSYFENLKTAVRGEGRAAVPLQKKFNQFFGQQSRIAIGGREFVLFFDLLFE
jgi:hypothetical protein